MLNSIRKSRLAAIAGLLALGAGSALFAAPVTIDGGTSAVVDGWKISPDVGVTVQADTVSGSLVITKIAIFATDAPLDIQFQQTPLVNSDNAIQVASEMATNSTGADWTGFTFSLTAPASFGGVFAPPANTGVNYTTATIDPQRTMVAYTGSQVSGSTADWNDASTGDSLEIFAPVSAPTFPPTTFTLVETPMGPSVSAVPLPAAAWQTSVTLLALGLVAAGRKTSKA